MCKPNIIRSTVKPAKSLFAAPKSFERAAFGRADAGDAKIPATMKRIFLSARAAIPATFVAFSLADSAKTPNFIRYLIAPGYFFSSLHVHLSFESRMSLDLLTIGAYYTAIIYLISFWIDARARSRTSEDSGPNKS